MSRIDIICQYEGGEITSTGFNGTLQEAREYFEGKYFNLGIEKDFMVKCLRVCLAREIRTLGGGVWANKIIEEAEYAPFRVDEIEMINLVNEAGIISSPLNSTMLYKKDGKQWIFFLWIGGKVTVIDISDIYEDYLRLKLSA
jgi:hypothetical protein